MLPYGRQLPQRLLRLWKYQSVEEAGQLLLKLFSDWLSAEKERLPVSGSSVVMPVPLHPFRLAQRGFNQAAMAAKVAAAAGGSTFQDKWLQRNWQWKKQAKINDDQRRRQNAANSIRLRVMPERWPEAVLVDDVMTTGATLGECARHLRQAGYPRVSAITILRG